MNKHYVSGFVGLTGYAAFDLLRSYVATEKIDPGLAAAYGLMVLVAAVIVAGNALHARWYPRWVDRKAAAELARLDAPAGGPGRWGAS